MLNKCTTHTLALKLGVYGQRREDGGRGMARRASKNRMGEQDVTNSFVLREGKQGQAWLSCGVFKERGNQRSLVFARKRSTFDAQNGICISCSCFNDPHDAQGF